MHLGKVYRLNPGVGTVARLSGLVLSQELAVSNPAQVCELFLFDF